MKAVFRHYWIAILFATLVTLPAHICRAQGLEEVIRMTFKTRHQSTGATRNYQTDTLTVELDGSRLTVVGYFASGRTDIPYQKLKLVFTGFNGRGFHQFEDDNATWQNLNTGDGICHSLSGSAEILAYIPDITLQGSFRFLCESTPATGNPFNTVIEGEFIMGLEGKVLSPTVDDVVPPDTTWSVRWNLPGRDKVDIYYVLEPDPKRQGAERYLIVEGIETQEDKFDWEVPDTMSPHGYIVVIDPLNPDVPVIGEQFRLRGPRLARITTDPNGPCAECPYYEEFTPKKHGWPDVNGDEALFHPLGEKRIGVSPDYRNDDDPATGLPYGPLFTSPPVWARNDLSPEWPHWEEAFGFLSCYTSHERGKFIANERVVRYWRYHTTPYEGSCAGMAISAAMAFADPDRFAIHFSAIGSLERARNLYQVSAANTDISDLITVMMCYQYGAAANANYEEYGSTATPNDVIADLQEILTDDDRSTDGYLTIASTGPDGGGHALLAYRLEIDDTDKTAKIYVYDPNYPGGESPYVSINMESNTWSYRLYDGLTWGGKDYMYLSEELENFWAEAEPDFREAEEKPAAMYALRAPTIRGTSSTEEAFNYSAENGFTATASSITPIYPMNGRSAPLGYRLPRNGYSVDVTATQDSGTGVMMVRDNLIFTYASDARKNETDRISWDERSITVYNPEARVRTIYFDALFELGEGWRTLGVSDLMLTGGDSIRFEIAGEELIVKNYGRQTGYNLVVRQVYEQGSTAGDYPRVDLPAGDIHRIAPPWWNLGTKLPIHVADTDGTPKDTIYLINSLLSVDESPRGAIDEPSLPNPLPDFTAVDLHLPHSGLLHIEAFNALGQKVCTLFEGEREAGSLRIPIDARKLEAGYYILHVTLDGQSIGSIPVVRTD